MSRYWLTFSDPQIEEEWLYLTLKNKRTIVILGGIYAVCLNLSSDPWLKDISGLLKFAVWIRIGILLALFICIYISYNKTDRDIMFQIYQ